MNDLVTYNKNGFECPFCGYINEESYEIGDELEGCGEIFCQDCDKEYFWSRSITIHYTTRPLKSK
jgi:transcription elongation factor Elf1